MTPLHIQIMLHYYCTVTPYAENDTQHRYSAATIAYTQQLVNADMLTSSTCKDVYVVTEKGRAYIEALKAVQMPVEKTIWVQPGDL